MMNKSFYRANAQKQSRPWLRLLILGVGVAVATQYAWVQAAVVYAVSPNNCSSELIQNSRLRLQGLYGSVASEPWIACLSEPRLGLGQGIGSTHFAPAMPSILIVNEDGQNVDVLAHEWSHAELARRVGFWKRNVETPTWFDEGVAMQVDMRSDYGVDCVTQVYS